MASAHAGVRILDLGTGSGCILLALLTELQGAWGVGVDVSIHALEVARQNAAALGLAGRAGFVLGDWASGLRGGFDIVVSNPPYIAERDLAGLEPEVARFEPRLALSGGTDGLAAYRAIAPQLARLLAPRGAAFLEVGVGAAGAVTELMRNDGFEHIEINRRFCAYSALCAGRQDYLGQQGKKQLETHQFPTSFIYVSGGCATGKTAARHLYSTPPYNRSSSNG